MKLEEAKRKLDYYKKILLVTDETGTPNDFAEAIETVLQALDNSVSKDKVKERIEETDLKINNLKTEISKTLKENEEAGTETEIDINEQYICNMEIELEKLEIAQKVLEKLLEDKQC